MQRAMKKELIICLVIICSIVIGDIWLQNYTSKTLDTISTNLETLKEILDDNKYSREKIIQVNDEWDKKFNILTCFLEHDELEKVKTQLVVITAGIDLCCLLNLFAELQPTMNQEPANRELYKSKGAFCNGT